MNTFPLWIWVIFNICVLIALTADLFFLKKKKDFTIRKALGWSIIWIALAFLFAAWLAYAYSGAKAIEFLSGYLLEKSLSIDNLFVFVLVFNAFQIPASQQERVLKWGIISALLLRSGMIALGAVLIHRFHFIIPLMGLFLIWTGVQMGRGKEGALAEKTIQKMSHLKIPFIKENYGNHFLIRHAGKLYATPLLLALICIEITDIIFAIDSIPAIFGLTQDPFIIYTATVFALLGLRALYFAISGSLLSFPSLKKGLCAVLIFVGLKMAITPWIKVPLTISFPIILFFLIGSLFLPKKKNMSS